MKPYIGKAPRRFFFEQVEDFSFEQNLHDVLREDPDFLNTLNSQVLSAHIERKAKGFQTAVGRIFDTYKAAETEEEEAKEGRHKFNEKYKYKQYWTKEEHQRFLVGLQLFGRDWQMVQPLVGTRSYKQIISHF
tara:strand:- start:194 stop:592 length:399 start_codon:yes stop_codon:yes gene_type:complete